jgi:hypothetical protein
MIDGYVLVFSLLDESIDDLGALAVLDVLSGLVHLNF